MGLTLHFELRLPGNLDREEVTKRLERLQAVALTIPVCTVSSVYSADHCVSNEEIRADPLQGAFRLFAELIADTPAGYPGGDMNWDESSALGFVVDPGRGSELAAFGFVHGRDDAGTHEEWTWYTSCKTQYASVVSEENFVNCHTGLVSILDHAMELGIDVVVEDETEYWESRDDAILIESVRRMNHIMAAFAGKLSDALTPEHKLEASIFAHPEFERIEMKP